MIQQVAEALHRAKIGESNINSALLSYPGMSGHSYRRFINNLMSSLPAAHYLEVGTWLGSTLCSALNGNDATAVAIDNWAEFGGNKPQLFAALHEFVAPTSRVKFLEEDFRRVDYTKLNKANVFMFDGPHEARDQFDGIALALPALEDRFVLIVDDWNWDRVREGTFAALEKLKLSVLWSEEIRTTQDGTHPLVGGAETEWHNGYFISVIKH